jgi:hypothetical protein
MMKKRPGLLSLLENCQRVHHLKNAVLPETIANSFNDLSKHGF